MKRERAVRIHERLLDAERALDEARRAIAGLGLEERLRFDSRLRKIVAGLHRHLLAPIYDQYPDLEPPPVDEVIPTICSELRWDQVRLPASVSGADLDGVIFSCLGPFWRKTAMIVILSMKRCQELGLAIDDEVIAARLQMLAESGRIEGIGDLRMWAHSEVRLKD